MGILRLGHVDVRVPDLDLAAAYYTSVLGLIEVVREPGKVYLKCWDEQDHHSIILHESEIPGCDYIAFKVDNEATLERLSKDIEKFGCRVEYIPAGELKATGERIRFQIPTGHHVELYAEKKKIGNGLGDINPGPWPDGLRGMQPTRMDHWQIHGVDLEGSVQLFTRVLGFGLAECVLNVASPASTDAPSR